MIEEHHVEIFPKYEITLYDNDPRMDFTYWNELYEYETTGRYKIINGKLEIEVKVPHRYKEVHWEWWRDGYIIPRRITVLHDTHKSLWIPENNWVINEEIIYRCGEEDE